MGKGEGERYFCILFIGLIDPLRGLRWTDR